MVLSDRQMLDAFSRKPFVDSAELALALGEPHTTVHRELTGLLAAASSGGRATAPPTCRRVRQRYYLTANGIRKAAELLGFGTPSLS